ncbi:MAG TPA: Rossmann-like and DUF2520 domain-containing protein, partial [Puia sp.]
MDIIIIGSGNVATRLGRKFREAGHRILQVFSRNPSHAVLLAEILNATPISALSEMKTGADLILLAISDNAYPEFVHELSPTGSFVVHTAGSVPMEVLKNTSSRYGVLYPLQSFRRELEDQPEFPLLIDANNPGSLEELKEMAAGLSKTILPAGNEMRLKYHLAAVLAGNFSNHLYSLTESWCRREEIDFGLLQPLIRETAGRLLNELPE